MKALVKISRGSGNLELRDMPEPTCVDDEVKIEVAACGVCGTDIHIWKDTFPSNPPVIIGHEFAGTVVEAGRATSRFKVGERVVAENVCLNCGGTCHMCVGGHYAICVKRGAQGLNADGAFARWIVCKEKNVYRIPDNISLEEGALFEPLVCSVHAVLDQARPGAADLVLVTGPGAIGLLVAQAARTAGAEVILSGTSADAERLAVAVGLGIERVVNVHTGDLKALVMDLSRGRGADAVIECSGVESAAASGIELLRKRGSYTQVGLFGRRVALDMDSVAMKELTIRGSVSHTRNAWERSLKLVEQGKIKLAPLITARLPLAEWHQAFEKFERREGIKTLLIPE